MTRKVLYISGTRADFGLMKFTLKKIDSHPDLSLNIIATGMHVMEEFGNTIGEIERENFPYHRLDLEYEEDNKKSMARFVGRAIQSIIDKVVEIKPDIILLLGDRGEMLAGAVVGSYLGIPLAHVHGGEVTLTVDEVARHAITKLSHIHFPATERSKKRIIKMGEKPENVHNVGAPGLDSIKRNEITKFSNLSEKYELGETDPLLIVVQHPVSGEVKGAGGQMRETLEAIAELEYPTVIIYPNADAGGRKMIDVIKKYENLDFVTALKNMPRPDFLGLMKAADAMIGNTSSGIIEAPSLNLPFINVGDRQEGRERGDNVIEVSYDRKEVKSAIKTVLRNQFKKRIKGSKNPYEMENTCREIANILAEKKIDDSLLRKKITY